MIRRSIEDDLASVMKIWLDTNIRTHDFIPRGYWINAHSVVKEMLPRAEVYVYEDDGTHQVLGFIGIINDHIEGIFIKEAVQSRGIGKQLLDYVKEDRSHMSLNVYQKNIRAIAFYQREQFMIRSEDIDDATNEKELFMTWDK